MVERARQKMIASINALTQRNDCTEAVILQKRPLWAFLGPVAVFLVVMVVLVPVGLGAIVNGAIGGGLAGLSLMLATTSTLIGRCGDKVLVANVSRLRPGIAKEIVAELDAPVSGEVLGGWMNKKVTFNGENYLVHKTLEERFGHVIS